MIVDINSIREKTKENIELNKTAEILYVNKMIIKAAESGQWSFKVLGLYKETIKSLKDAGYNVQRTPSGYVISWQ